MSKWRHCRFGLYEGTIIREDGDWVDIELSAPARITYAGSFSYGGHGRPYSSAAADQIIRTRKSFLTEIEEEVQSESEKAMEG